MHGLLPESRPVPLAALAPERTCFLTSTSKTLAPGLRIAYVLAPAAMVPRLTDSLRAYAGSPVDRMMRGPIYATFTGLKSESEVGFWTPKRKFAPRRLTQWVLAGPAAAAAPGLGFRPSPSPRRCPEATRSPPRSPPGRPRRRRRRR